MQIATQNPLNTHVQLNGSVSASFSVKYYLFARNGNTYVWDDITQPRSRETVYGPPNYLPDRFTTIYVPIDPISALWHGLATPAEIGLPEAAHALWKLTDTV